MLTANGRLKLADFGIAAAITESHSRLSQVSLGSTSGTPCYMSPQQARGFPPRAGDDIYAVGATFYELIAGKPPFYRGKTDAILLQVLSETPPSMAVRRSELGVGVHAAIPEAWEITIAACLAKDRVERPASAAEILIKVTGLTPSEKRVTHQRPETLKTTRPTIGNVPESTSPTTPVSETLPSYRPLFVPQTTVRPQSVRYPDPVLPLKNGVGPPSIAAQLDYPSLLGKNNARDTHHRSRFRRKVRLVILICFLVYIIALSFNHLRNERNNSHSPPDHGSVISAAIVKTALLPSSPRVGDTVQLRVEISETVVAKQFLFIHYTAGGASSWQPHPEIRAEGMEIQYIGVETNNRLDSQN